MQPKLESQSPVTREMAEQAANDYLVYQKHFHLADDTMAAVMACYILQSTPFAAWDEKRCREFVRRCLAIGRTNITDADQRGSCDRLTAELASMPGGMVEGDAVSAKVEELFTNGFGEKADRLVLTTKDGKDLGGWCRQAIIERLHIISGRGADDSANSSK